MGLLLVLVHLLGCTSEPASDKIVVVTGGGHSAASAEDFTKYSFACCDDLAVADTIAAYVDLSDALAADNIDRAHAAGAALAARAQAAAEASSLSEEDRAHAATIAALAAPWGGDDIKGIRADLSDVAAAALPLAKAHRGGEPLRVVTAFCPMAPGRWLQAKPQLANPYYGAEMLTCGVFEE